MTEPWTNPFSLSGKCAIVTGACGTLGPAICEGLARMGADVAVVDVRPGAAAEQAARLSDETGRDCAGFDCDVGDEAGVQAMTKAVLDRFGTPQILIHGAANSSSDLQAYFSPYEGYTLEEWRRNMAVDLDGFFLVGKHLGGAMAAGGQGGSIVQIGTIYALMGSDNRIYEGAEFKGISISNPAVYSAAKAGTLGLTRWMATYWAEKGVRVNALIPGGVEAGQNDTFKQRYSNRIPMGRMATRDDIVGPLLWLASDASSYVTGQYIYADGGLSAW